MSAVPAGKLAPSVSTVSSTVNRAVVPWSDASTRSGSAAAGAEATRRTSASRMTIEDTRGGGGFPICWCDMDSMILMTVFGQVATYIAIVGLLLPFVLYVVARWRAHREPTGNPQLGMKVALGYFLVTALQVLARRHRGPALYAIISSDEDKGSLYRAGFG